MALDCGGVDKTITLGPFRGTSMIFIVPNVLYHIYNMPGEKNDRIPGYKNYGHDLLRWIELSRGLVPRPQLLVPGIYPQIVRRILSQKSFPIPNLAATANR
jgi:hypothetical protein